MLQQIVRRIPRGVRDSALRACDRLCAGYCGLTRQVPFSAWSRISPADARTFAPVLNTWLPAQGKPARQLRWLMTEWCNYHCAYCVGEHGRWAVKSRGCSSHAADNHPVEKYEDAFRRHFSAARLSVNISGGEPFLDRPFITRMVNFFCLVRGICG
jgi:sulfatase maturation enzyme AslB (radical SAM superfamily)